MFYANKQLISIIIPVYNVALYLRQCIESITNQEGNIEIILVDDGSPDDCPAICDEYSKKDSRIKVIHKQNGGVSSARNAGLDIAQGEWIWFIDGDDYIEQDTLPVVVNAINKSSASDLIQMGMKYLYGDNLSDCIVDNVINLNKDSFLQKYISFHNHRILFRREIIEKHNLRFTKGLKVSEDQEFQLKYMMLCKNPIQISLSPYIYRQREGSVTHNSETYKRVVDDTFTVLENLISFINKNNIKVESWLEGRISRMVRTLLYSASNINDIKKKDIKRKLNIIASKYENAGFSCFNDKKIKLARKNITLYFLLNKLYLKTKGV